MFLTHLTKFLSQWRKKGNNEVILMADMNKYIGNQGDLQDFCLYNDLTDTVGLLNPALENDTAYLYGKNRIDYILVSHTSGTPAIKAGHHQFNQHFISDHKGVYINFNAKDLFDNAKIDRTHNSYRRLRLGRQDIVLKYINSWKSYMQHIVC